MRRAVGATIASTRRDSRIRLILALGDCPAGPNCVAIRWPFPGGWIALGSSYPARGPSGFLVQERQRALICGVIARGEPSVETLQYTTNYLVQSLPTSFRCAVHVQEHGNKVIQGVQKVVPPLRFSI